MKKVLGLDCSSTHIGWCLWTGTAATAHGTIALRGDLTARISLAEIALSELFIRHAPDVIAIEGATTRYASHVIAQQRVVGVLMLAATRMGLLTVEIAPATAKKALTGSGKADKQLMQTMAANYLQDYDEHAADALGVALAAYPLVRVEEVAA